MDTFIAFRFGVERDSDRGVRDVCLVGSRDRRRVRMAAPEISVAMGTVCGGSHLCHLRYRARIFHAAVGSAIYHAGTRGDSIHAGAGGRGSYLVPRTRGAVGFEVVARSGICVWRNPASGMVGPTSGAGVARTGIPRANLFRAVVAAVG